MSTVTHSSNIGNFGIDFYKGIDIMINMLCIQWGDVVLELDSIHGINLAIRPYMAVIF